MVLRVSNTFVFVPDTAFTNSLVNVEMPLIRCSRFRITRSQDRMAAALCRITANDCPFFTFNAVEDLGVAHHLEAAYGVGVHLCKDFEEDGDAAQSGDYASLFGDDGS